MSCERILVGFPDPKLLAADIASTGYTSCEAAEAAGWLVTEHEPTRREVNRLLENYFLSQLVEVEIV